MRLTNQSVPGTTDRLIISLIINFLYVSGLKNRLTMIFTLDLTSPKHLLGEISKMSLLGK